MDYIIGAGALLETGANGGMTPANLHAHVDAALASQVVAVAVDFESTSPEALTRLLVVGQGWNTAAFRQAVCEPLRAKGDCDLADVLTMLARGTQSNEVHLFAHWLPVEQTYAQLRDRGVALVAHPLESIQAASIVTGQRHRRVA